MITEENKFLGLEEIKIYLKKYTQHSRRETMSFLDIVTAQQK